MLAKESESSKFMYNAINEEYEIANIIYETSVSKSKLLKRRIKKLGILRVFGQIVFQIIIVRLLKKSSKKRVKGVIKECNFNTKEIENDKIINVDSVNNKNTISKIKEINPDVIIVNGTRILSSKVLEATNAVIVNTHVGITPKYRGVHGGYWALVNKDYENLGVTIHLIDEGVDTGNIIYQDVIKITNRDNFITYPLLQLNKGIELMKLTLNDIKTQNIKTSKNNLKSKLWYHPTIWQYLYHRLNGGVK